MKELFICEYCKKEFNSKKICENHEYECKKAITPPIQDKPYVVEYEVLKADCDDYCSINLKDMITGKITHDDAYKLLANSNINLISKEKLIGKKIRITSYTEIIG